MLNKLFKSIIDSDQSPVVVCDVTSKIVYMNRSAISHYRCDLTGKNLKNCHDAATNEKIDKVLSWFMKSKDNNTVYTYHNDAENKDVYMIALRDDDGTLIGYYEKHEYRNAEKMKLYDISE